MSLLNVVNRKGGERTNGEPKKKYPLALDTPDFHELQRLFDLPDTMSASQTGVMLLQYAICALAHDLVPDAEENAKFIASRK